MIKIARRPRDWVETDPCLLLLVTKFTHSGRRRNNYRHRNDGWGLEKRVGLCLLAVAGAEEQTRADLNMFMGGFR